MPSEISSLFVRIGANLSGLQNGLASTRSQLKNLGSEMTAIGGTLTAGLTLPLVGVGVAAAKAATDLNTQMKNIQSISKDTNANTETLRQQFIAMSTDLTKTRDSAENLAKGFYQIQSSGFFAADATKVLEASTKAAAAGLTNTETAVKVVTSVLNAYSMKASEATHVSDVLFKAVDIGIFNFEQLSNAIGDTLGSAQAVGVPLEEVAAGLATISKAGINVNEAATSLNQVFLSLIKPGSDAKDTAAALGIEWNAAALKAKGLGGLIKELADHTNLYSIVATGADDKLKAQLSTLEAQKNALDKWMLSLKAAGKMTKDATKEYQKQSAALKLQEKNLNEAMDANVDYVTVMNQMAKATGVSVDQLAALFPNVRALRGILALMRNDGKDFAKDLETIAGSAGATGAAFDIQTQSWAASMDNFKNRATAVLIELGDVIMPILLDVGTAVLPVIENFKKLDPQFIRVAVVVGMVVAAVGPLLVGLGLLMSLVAAMLSPIGLLAAGLVGIGVVVAVFFDKLKASGKLSELEFLFKRVAVSLEEMATAIKNNDPEAFFKAFQEMFTIVSTRLGEALKPIYDAIIKWIGDTAKDIETNSAKWGTALFAWTKNVTAGTALGEAITNIETSFKSMSTNVINAVTPIKTWMDANAPGLFAALITAGVVLSAAWTAMVATLKPSFDALGVELAKIGITFPNVLNALVAGLAIVIAIVAALLAAGLSLVIGFVNGFVTAFTNAQAGLRYFSFVFAAIMETTRALLAGWVAVFVRIFSGDIPGALQQAITNIGLFVVLLGQMLVGAGVIVFTALSAIAGYIWGFVTGVIGFFRQLYDELVGHSIIPDMMDAIVLTIVNGLKIALAKWEEMMTALKDAATKKWNEIVQTTKDKIGEMLAWLTKQREEFFKIGQLFIEGLKQGIKDKFDSVINGLRELFASMKDVAADILQLKSPSKVGMDIGENFSLGVAAGVARGAGELMNSIASMSNVMIGAPSLSNESAAFAGGGRQGATFTLNIDAPILLDGYQVGRLVFQGTQEEARARGLTFAAVA